VIFSCQEHYFYNRPLFPPLNRGVVAGYPKCFPQEFCVSQEMVVRGRIFREKMEGAYIPHYASTRELTAHSCRTFSSLATSEISSCVLKYRGGYESEIENFQKNLHNQIIVIIIFIIISIIICIIIITVI